MTMISLLLLTLLSQDAEKLLDEADAAFHGKDFDKAIELYTKVHQQDSKRADALIGRCRAKSGKKDYDGAIEDATLATKLDFGGNNPFVDRAIAKWKKGDRAGAITDFGWGIVTDPKDLRIYKMKAECRKEAGDLDGAIEDLSDALQIDGRNAELWHERALLKREKRDFVGAVGDYSKALEQDPDNLEHYYWRGLSSYNDRSHEAAIRDFQKVLELDPKYFLAAYYLGVVHGDRKDRSAAAEAYTRCLKLKPDYVPALTERARREIELGRIDAALADCDQALKLASDERGAVHYYRGIALTAKGEWKAATAAYERLKEINPRDWPGLQTAAAMLSVLAELAADTSRDPVAKRLTVKARGLIERKNYGAAISILEVVIKIDVKAKDAYELLAQTHFERNDPKLGDGAAARDRAWEAAEFGQGVSPQTRKIIFERGSLVLGGLIWLARHQSADGRWSADAFGEACGKDGSPRCEGKGGSGDDLRTTSLALLSLLGAGYSQLSKDDYGAGPMGVPINAGLQWLIRQQNPDGRFGDGKSGRFLEDHAIAAMAVSEAYGMTAAEALKEPALKSIAFLKAAKLAGKGWPKGKPEAGVDSEATGWALLALYSAKIGEFPGAPEEFDSSLELARKTRPQEGSLGDVLAIAAEACARTPEARNDLQPRLLGLIRMTPKAQSEDLVRFYVATLALRWGDGKDLWTSWKGSVKVVSVQASLRIGENLCLAGSWNPDPKDGRLLATVFHLLTLELYYGYRNAFGTVGDHQGDK